MNEGEGGPGNVGWIPGYHLFPSVSHYYGDAVRQFMLGGAIVMMIAGPFYNTDLSSQAPLEIIGGLCIVAFAALTNPFKSWVMIFDALLAGAGAAIIEMWALSGYTEVADVAFILREFIAILFILGFYFSLKTLRAMSLHQVGKPDSAAEFRRTLVGMPQPGEESKASDEFDPLWREKKATAHTEHERFG